MLCITLLFLLPSWEILIIWLVSWYRLKSISENMKDFFHKHLRMHKIVVQPKSQYNNQLLKTRIRFFPFPQLLQSTLKMACSLKLHLLYRLWVLFWQPNLQLLLRTSKTLDSVANRNHQTIPTFRFWVPEWHPKLHPKVMAMKIIWFEFTALTIETFLEVTNRGKE